MNHYDDNIHKIRSTRIRPDSKNIKFSSAKLLGFRTFLTNIWKIVYLRYLIILFYDAYINLYDTSDVFSGMFLNYFSETKEICKERGYKFRSILRSLVCLLHICFDSGTGLVISLYSFIANILKIVKQKNYIMIQLNYISRL